jgi:hypothetical protein
VDVLAEIGDARPARERCIIYRSHEVDEAEHALKWGLVAFVSGTRRAVSCSAALAAVLAVPDVGWPCLYTQILAI